MARTLFISADSLVRGDPVAVLSDTTYGGSVSTVDMSRGKVPSAERTVIVLNGGDVLSLDAPLPARSDAEARRAVPFAVEDFVAEPLDQVHFAIGPLEADGQRAVRVVSGSVMDEVLTRIGSFGLERVELMSEHDLGIPAPVLIEFADEVIAFLPSGRFRVGANLPDEVFGRLLKQADMPANCRVYGERLATRLGFRAEGPAPVSQSDLLVLLTRLGGTGDRAGVNLLQGRYGRTGQLDLSGLGDWKRVAVLAIAFGGAALVAGELEKSALQTEIRRLETASQQQVAARFPDAAAGSAVATVRQALSLSRKGPDEFETLTAALYAAIGQRRGSRLSSLRYDQEQGVLSAGVTLAAFSDAEAVAGNLRESGLSVEVGDLRQSGNGVTGEIRVQVLP